MRKRPFHTLLSRSPVRHRGSALLIVLGFLSFMVISAVSFAIYMRTERQASSNYRHAVNARHLLNLGLARAMEEVDSELRRKSNTSLKFPDWPGRVLVSAIPASDDDVQRDSDARVLSLEALSFLPPFLVNDVRRYAYRQDGDEVYKGAKWRLFSSGIKGKDASGSVVGRYAYVCVNVSDMLNVNTCRAQCRDISTNRVSLGHLFDNDTQRQAFDDNAEADGHYFSLQDFYSARYEQDSSVRSSPFHNYIAGSSGFTPFENTDLLKQVFITDGIVRPEPADQDACNIWLDPPIDPVLLNNPTPRPPESPHDLNMSDGFWKALGKVFNIAHNDSEKHMVMAAMLKDYIDTDHVPSLLNAPCLEMVPMISQVTIPKDILKYEVKSRIVGGAQGQPQATMYTLHLLEGGSPIFPIQVEVVRPFKNMLRRGQQPSFALEIEAFFVVDKNGAERDTGGFQNRGEWIRLEMASGSTILPPQNYNNENECFEVVTATLRANPDDVKFDVMRDAEYLNGFTANFRVSLCMFVRIKEGDVWVDSVPHRFPVSPLPEALKGLTPKLYYQTKSIALTPGVIVPTPYEWEWTNLEVADPRFNHKAANWVKNDNEQYPISRGLNKYTRDDIRNSLDGRDADIFMFVANTGVLQSPGELGFIIRPHTFGIGNDPPRNFKNETEPADKEHMFRTIRLYDHGGTGADRKKDEVYKYFYAMRSDGTLPGARVNPLSDMPEVLEAAIWDTPLDYWIASTNNGLTVADRVGQKLTFTRSPNYFNTASSSDSNWQSFRDKWTDGLEKVMAPGNNPNNPNKIWGRTVVDYYGSESYFRWYSETPNSIFGITVPNNLHEVDRKMLYSFSLDSFSDRQQLFLYFIRAETTVPTFGSAGKVSMQSLAGSRAVALVWRDPYPRGFVKDDKAENNDNNDDTMNTSNDWYPDDRNTDFESPWKRYQESSDPVTRHASHHDTRVLFFKQLGQ
ncbi:MAG TPA: hypothetical protein PK251_16085 [Candidatus Latescibacteria bacterium]|nr:hypothetical protein [Candidatus Latescibacterota bacterium]HRT30050.1 hypothetical protein [Kiritimatiellia bacterium]